MPLGTEVGLGPGDIVLNGNPAPIVLDGDTAAPRKGVQQSPTFWPMSAVAKRSPISTALSSCWLRRRAAYGPFFLRQTVGLFMHNKTRITRTVCREVMENDEDAFYDVMDAVRMSVL